jgi:hypothetical protein
MMVTDAVKVAVLKYFTMPSLSTGEVEFALFLSSKRGVNAVER